MYNAIKRKFKEWNNLPIRVENDLSNMRADIETLFDEVQEQYVTIENLKERIDKLSDT